ncbi:MAG TPA: hypothetical protein VM283_05325 [Armatimonadota bacterium]|nr:hypothetical protein [Armatimonadota bacterium]
MPEEEAAVATTIEVSQARSEARAGHIAFIGGFLLLIFAVPLVQTAWELGRGEPVQALDVFARIPTAEGLTQYERALEERSVIARAVRERWHWLSLVALRGGNQKAVVARERTLFYRPSLDFTLAPGFMRAPFGEGHPVPAIVAFRDSLRRQDVELVLLIAPGKESIYPEWLSRRYQLGDGPPSNQDMQAFLDAMQRAGIPAIYPAEALWRGKLSGPMYLREDTHWTPEGMALAVDELARALGEGPAGPGGPTTRALAVTRHGDLYDMLGLPGYLPAPLPPETVTVQQVVDASGRPVEPDAESPVVLLGDSFTNIFSVAAMGWGDHAGLGEQLALRLGGPVDIIALNDGGVNTARMNLARRPDALAGKRVVVWQFAARDLVVSNGQWRLIEIGARREADADETR